jgi:ribose 5-phosphate isomerase A
MNIPKHQQNDIAKQAAGKAAVNYIQDGMLIGLGTGSTASYFIDALIERCHTTTLKIHAVATSERSYQQAKSGGISLYDINQITQLDMTIDGADEIDRKKQMIKGGGGALLREKIVAYMSQEMVVIVDDTKLVEYLGCFPLPVEILPFAYQSTLNQIHLLGFQGRLRQDAQGQLYVTDNGNYIVDIVTKHPFQNPQQDHALLKSIPGVIETGFFLNMAGRVIVGHNDGSIDIIE